jgi:hypothetical protein
VSSSTSFYAASLFACVLAFAPIAHGQDVDVPPKPTDYLLDQGRVFPAEIAKRLQANLETCAKQHGIHVYVVTQPTLKVMPSRERDHLEQLGRAATEAWTKGEIGAVVVFDDEAGWVTVGASELAEERFSRVQLNMLMKDPNLEPRKKRASPAKLEQSAMVVVNGLIDLNAKYAQERKRQGFYRMIFGAIFVVAAIIGAVGLLVKRRGGTAPAPAPAPE